MKKFLKIVFFILFFLNTSLYSDDLCYGEPKESSFFGFFDTTKIPIHYIGNKNNSLQNVTVYYGIKGFNPVNFNQNIGIDDKEKSLENDNPDKVCLKRNSLGICKKYYEDKIYRAEKSSFFSVDFGNGMPNFSMFEKGIIYHLGDMNETNNTHVVWTKSFFSLENFFMKTKLFATYMKNGKEYHVILNPCQNNDKTVPSISISDAMVTSTNHDQNMSFHVTLNGTLSDGVTDGNKIYIHYYTVDGTAKAGRDYVSTDNTLIIPKDEKSAEINVTIKAFANPGIFHLILDNAYGARIDDGNACLLYTSPSPRDRTRSRMPSSA
jgi:hypothetical protein